MKKLTILLLSIVFSLQVYAETKEIIQEGKGVASTREEAIKKAIFEAVARAKGINVNSKELSFRYESVIADVEKTPSGGKEVGLDVVSIRANHTAPQTEIRALIKTYEILEESKIDPNTWQVKVKAWIYDYQTPEKNNRIRIAVMPPEIDQHEFYFGNIEYTAPECKELEKKTHQRGIKLKDKKIGHLITQALNSKLNAANKFAILDRQYVDKLLLEKELIWCADGSLEDKAKIGNLLGADYLLTITLNEAQIPVDIKYLQSIGQCSCEHEAKIKLDYSLIVAASGQIKYSDSVNIWLEYNADVQRLVPQWRNDRVDYSEITEQLINLAVSPIVETIAEGLYPAKITKILPNGMLIINKGSAEINNLETFEVLSSGTELFDYDTKESLGNIEEHVAQIKITRVLSNFSYAMVIEGDRSRLTEGLICRRMELEQPQPPANKTDTVVTPTGGVKMPFDK
ncbi:MAG: CsgG/HfaB family protein [Phycisphaerales bacterium]